MNDTDKRIVFLSTSHKVAKSRQEEIEIEIELLELLGTKRKVEYLLNNK